MLPLLLAFGAGAAFRYLFKSNAKTTSVSTGLESKSMLDAPLPAGFSQVVTPGAPAFVSRPTFPILPGTRAEAVSSAQRRSYDTAAAASKALLEQYNKFVVIALQDLQLGCAALYGRGPGLSKYPQGISSEADTNAMRVFAKKLAYVRLTAQANHLRALATQIDNMRAGCAAPGGPPLSPPTYTSPFAVTRGTWLPGMSFIVKPAHFRDMDGEKALQTFIGKMIPIINSFVGLGMIPYADPTLHSGTAWKGVWSSYGRDPMWGTYSGGELGNAINYLRPFDSTLYGVYPEWIAFAPPASTGPPRAEILISTESGTSQQGIFAAAAAVLQIPGFKEFLDTVWLVPDGTHARVLQTDPSNPNSPLIEKIERPGGDAMQYYLYGGYARVQFQLPQVGAGSLGTAEGFIEMQDLERRMVYSEGAVV